MVLHVRHLATAGPNWTNAQLDLFTLFLGGVATYGSSSQSRAGYRACMPEGGSIWELYHGCYLGYKPNQDINIVDIFTSSLGSL